MGKRKERAVKYFAVFMLFMLICTIVSRGIYAYQMPKVQTGLIDKHALSHTIEASGNVLTKDEIPVTVAAGLLVEQVAVVEGQKVEPGDLLFQIEATDLAELMYQADAQISAEEARLAQLNTSGNTALNRAGEDLRAAEENGANEVNQANAAYQEAKDALVGFPSWEEYKENAYKKDAEYQKLLKASQKKSAGKEEKEALSSYKKSLDQTLKEAYAQEKAALEQAAGEKEQAKNAAEANRSDAVKQAERALEDAKQSGGGDAGTKIEQQNQIKSLKENREKLQQISDTEGKVFCGIQGYVSRISVRAGERTGDVSVMVLSDAEGEKLFQAVLPAEERAYINTGDLMDISFQSGQKQLNGVEITAIGELEDGSCQITGKIEDKEVAIGEIGALTMNQETGRYNCCIPLSALYSENGTDYVYIVEEQQTILGTELTARKRKVKVWDKDENYAALEDGTLTDEEQFVVESDKDMKDGARIRLWEE